MRIEQLELFADTDTVPCSFCHHDATRRLVWSACLLHSRTLPSRMVGAGVPICRRPDCRAYFAEPWTSTADPGRCPSTVVYDTPLTPN